MIGIVVADDHEVVRTGFAAMLGTQPDFNVLGTAGDGAEAVLACRELRPDVVLMDIRMPGTDGIEATRQLTLDDQAPRVLILTTFDLDEYVFDALRAGASGFLLKEATAGQLYDAVRVIAAGDALLAPGVTRRLISEFARIQPPAAVPQPSSLAALTPRETEVLRLRRRGPVQHRDRRPPHRDRGHGQDPRQPPARQARPARPRPSGGHRVRVRPGRACPRALGKRYPILGAFGSGWLIPGRSLTAGWAW